MTDAIKLAIEALEDLIESVTGVDQVSLPHESGKIEGGAMKERIAARCGASAPSSELNRISGELKCHCLNKYKLPNATQAKTP